MYDGNLNGWLQNTLRIGRSGGDALYTLKRINEFYTPKYNQPEEILLADIARSQQQLGNIIHRDRKLRGLTQTELVNRTGLRQALISQIETGHDVAKMPTIDALFAAFDLDLMVGTR